ncbi:hypothetical protein ACQPXM_28655 [Kribbella sp. CA-253562]|uniref:hypothetical protein n=1 Tax=Kribbella sp. CA-253562 TaxID=3239942 RepID=UPI003D916A56
MTTPPQGPWSPGQPGGQPGGQHGGNQGGWGQQQPAQGGGWGQRPPQQGQPPQGQPPQGTPPQGGGGWGQQPGQPPQQPGQTGWGQQTPPQTGGYQQQPWGQKPAQQAGWHQQQGGQQPWQPNGPGGSGGGKDKMPLFIGGGIVGVLLIGLLVFVGIKALGGDDEPTTQPTTTTSTEPTNGPETPNGDPTGDPTGAPPAGELGNATGQAKTATDKLQADGYQCSDLFNGAQGAHRGCFKLDGASEVEAVFQFQPDGTILAVLIKSSNDENVNNAGVTFDAALQAIGNDAFGGSEVAKVQQAVKNGQKSQKVGSTWGEFSLRNNGDTIQVGGKKSGADELDVPRKEFQTTQAAMVAGLKAKKYDCRNGITCRKTLGKYGSQSIYGFASQGGGLRSFQMRASGDTADLKAGSGAVVADGLAVLQGPDVAALKAFVGARNDGKSYTGYVSGWRVEILTDTKESYGSQTVEFSYESFYV